MASKPVIKLSGIQEFFGTYANKALRRGENALESGHLLSFTYDPDLDHAVTKVHASMKKTSYQVDVNFQRSKVLSANCQCTRGVVSCSRIAAVLLHLHRNVSVTYKGCSWSVRKSKTKTNVKSIPSNDFKALQRTLRPEALREVVQNVDKCRGAAVSARWLMSPEPPRQENISLNVINPEDVIYSESFRLAPCKKAFVHEQLHLDWDTIVKISNMSVGQASNPLWTKLRRLRLTASKFGDILNIYGRPSHRQKPSPSLLKSLYNLRIWKKSKAHCGEESTKCALQNSTHGNTVRRSYRRACGLTSAAIWEQVRMVSVGSNGICEVKCPYSLRETVLEESVGPGSDFCMHFENGSCQFHQDHPYYHQIQAQIHFTRRQYCVFIGWTPKSMAVKKKIPVDPLWASYCLPLLKDFYVNEFVSSVLNQQG